MNQIKFRARSLESCDAESTDTGKRYNIKVGDWLYFTMANKTEHVGNVFWNCDKFHVHGFECDFETLSQFTGLTDKNGVETYNGDIWDFKISAKYTDMGYKGEEIGLVDWDVSEAGFFIQNISNKNWPYVSIYQIEHFTVIGNKFQNPELMK